VSWSNFRISPKASTWWKNLIALEKAVPNKSWFLESVSRKVGNGVTTLFWTSKWLGEAPLAVVFPRLFSLANQKDCMVCDLVNFVGDNRLWNFSWRRNLFHWEEELVKRLREMLDSVVFSMEEDCWRWLPDLDGDFSVKSAYNLLVKELLTEEELDDSLVDVFGKIWESPAPSKVIAFSWQLLYDRIPTRSNLEARGVVCSDKPWECLGCVGKVENSSHLFLHCPSAMKIWCEIFNRLGMVIVIPPSISVLFEVVRGSAKNDRIRKGFMMIWHATLWSIWKARNSAIFSVGCFRPYVIVEEIKVLSWKWSLGRLKISPCLFYEWCWDPGSCLLS
jgi:hypothetical protein